MKQLSYPGNKITIFGSIKQKSDTSVSKYNDGITVMSNPLHYLSNEPSAGWGIGSGIMWCNVAEAVCHCCFTCVKWLICLRRTEPPQGPAACAMPNDPCHITTHDASLPRCPREKGKDSLHQTIHTKIFVECNSWETARLSTSDHLHHKSTLSKNVTLLKGTKTHKRTLRLIFSLRLSRMSNMDWINYTVHLDSDHQQQWSGREKKGMRGLKSGENYGLGNQRQM